MKDVRLRYDIGVQFTLLVSYYDKYKIESGDVLWLI